jgi:hypothetical protein
MNKTEASKTEALTKPEPKIELTHDGRGNDRLVARGAAGRFVKKSTALAVENAKRVAKVMYMPDESGKTRLERILESQAKVAEENADPRNLGQVSSFLETADEISGQKMIRSKLSKEPDPVNAVKIIVVSTPQLMHQELKEADRKEPEPPPFLRAEILSTNDPTSI